MQTGKPKSSLINALKSHLTAAAATAVGQQIASFVETKHIHKHWAHMAYEQFAQMQHKFN